jgi:hypothetical protein
MTLQPLTEFCRETHQPYSKVWAEVIAAPAHRLSESDSGRSARARCDADHRPPHA